MPSVQHGQISTCDEVYNANVKERVKANNPNLDDEAHRAIKYLHECNQAGKKAVASMFTKNLFLDPNVKLVDVEAYLT